MSNEQFEPTIIGFLCNWCAYAGADLAGVSRLQYPPNLRTIQDAVFRHRRAAPDIEGLSERGGWRLRGGLTRRRLPLPVGNYMTVKRTAFMKKLLEFSGVDPERLVLKWVSSAEGPRFAQVVTDFVEKIRALGPSPLGRASAMEKAG